MANLEEKYQWFKLESGPVMSAIETFWAAHSESKKKALAYMESLGGDNLFGDLYEYGIAGMSFVGAPPKGWKKSPRDNRFLVPDKRTKEGLQHLKAFASFMVEDEHHAIFKAAGTRGTIIVDGKHSYLGNLTWKIFGDITYVGVPHAEKEYVPAEGMVPIPYHEFLRAKADHLAAKAEDEEASNG